MLHKSSNSLRRFSKVPRYEASKSVIFTLKKLLLLYFQGYMLIPSLLPPLLLNSKYSKKLYTEKAQLYFLLEKPTPEILSSKIFTIYL